MIKNTSCRNILLVLDSLESDWARDTLEEKDGTVRYYLLTFGFSPAQAFLKYGESTSDVRQRVSIIDTKNTSRIAEEEAREYYLNLIKELPDRKTSSGSSISENLSYQGKNLWWYLNISEKNIWTDKFIHRVYSLLRFLYTCEAERYDEIWFYVKDVILCDALVAFAVNSGIQSRRMKLSARNPIRKKGKLKFTSLYFFQLFREIFKVLVKLLALRFVGLKSTNNVPQGAVGFFSYFPAWWKNVFSGRPTDIFFGTIPGEIAKSRDVHYLVWLEPWREVLKKRGDIAAFLRQKTVTVLEGMLGLRDILALFDPSIYVRFFKILDQHNICSANINGCDISVFVHETLFDSLTHPHFVQNMLLDRAMQKVTLAHLNTLFFRLEFQPMERAILNNARGQTTTIGFQHSALGRNFLNYVFKAGELGEHWNVRNGSNAMPLPDYIITSGELGVKYMVHAGYPSDRVAVGGGIRFRQIYEYVKSRPEKHELRNRYSFPMDAKIVLLATSPLILETICMLSDTLEGLSTEQERVHLLVKCHPNAVGFPGYVHKISEILRRNDHKISYDVITKSGSLYDYISLSDILILTGGSVAIEALMLGVVPVIYVCPPQFSHNPMIDYPDSVFLAHDEGSIRQALEEIGGKQPKVEKKHRRQRPIRDMVYDLSEDPDERFLNVLRNTLHMEI